MVRRHRQVLHSTESREEGRIDSPQISPQFSDLPLCQWSLEELDFFFDSLGVLLMHEGPVQ